MKLTDFHTRDIANDGKKIFLPDPAGNLTDAWVIVRHVDSDEFRHHHAINLRRAAMLADEKDGPEKQKKLADLSAGSVAYLVAGWSFDEPCTHENVVGFLLNAPYISKLIDITSMDASLFFGQSSTASSNTAEQAQGSKSPRKAAKAR